MRKLPLRCHKLRVHTGYVRGNGEKGREGPCQILLGGFVRDQESVIREWYGIGVGERMTGSSNGAPCSWEIWFVNESDDLDSGLSKVARFPVTFKPTGHGSPGLRHPIHHLAPTSGLFNQTPRVNRASY